jgi:hypothetical protein
MDVALPSADRQKSGTDEARPAKKKSAQAKAKAAPDNPPKPTN